MSTTCTKDYTLTINNPPPPVDAYWDFAGGSLVDRVHGLTLVPSGFAGNQSLVSDVGLYNQGIGYVAGAGPVTRYRVGPVPQLAYLGNGYSFIGWFKVNAVPNTNNSNHFDFLYSNAAISTALRLSSNFGAPPNVLEYFSSFSFDQTFALPIGVWTFFHYYYDPNLNLNGLVLNDGSVVNFTTIPALVLAPSLSGFVQLDGTTGTDPVDLQFDELALMVSRLMTPAEVAYFYNGGAGRTWPLT